MGNLHAREGRIMVNPETYLLLENLKIKLLKMIKEIKDEKIK